VANKTMDRTGEAYPRLNKLPLKRFARSGDRVRGCPGSMAG
jgi:hypothetical protein